MRKAPLMRLAVILSILAILVLPCTASASLVYAVARISNSSPPFNQYQFGSFDINNPNTSGGVGNYTYQFTSLGSVSSTNLNNLAYNPTNSTIYVDSNASDFRSIDTAGNLSASSLGTTPSKFGAAFDSAGNFRGAHNTSWYTLNPATGASTGTATLTPAVYSSSGGNLAFNPGDGSYYFSHAGGPAAIKLLAIDSAGNTTDRGAFSGTGYDWSKYQPLFMHLGQLYMLNENRLYTVNSSNANLTLMGTITNLPTNFANGFTGAVSMTPAAAGGGTVPEPSTLAVVMPLLAWVASRVRRSRGV